MSLQIIVTTERGPDIGSPADQVAEALAAIGYIRSAPSHQEALKVLVGGVATSQLSKVSIDTMDKPTDTPAPQTAADPVVEQPKRERGKPAPGKKRRTAEEVAEDNAAEGIDTSVAETDEPEQQAISTGEERVGPQDDAPEVQAQDAADEAAEAEGGKIQDMLTHDDLRKAMGDYVTRYGMPAAQIDGPTIFTAALGDVPAGATEKDGTTPATAWRMTLVPDTQEALGKAVGAWREALAKNPWAREVAGG